MTDYINTDAYTYTAEDTDADDEYERRPYDYEIDGE